MLPSNDLQNFPLFVPDQVLTSENLNQLFSYLDAEGRMTRTNLIGIGIVCGLEVKNGIDGNGQYIAITKGTGVTSSGYLVTTPENGATDSTQTKYHKFKNYDAVKCRYYDPFVKISDKTQKFPLWELKETSETTGTSALNTIPGGLADKVVMLFVELLETNNKNCDPNSCDDKGINVDVTFRPLLVRKTDALNLINTGGGSGVTGTSFNGLKDLVMPRWDVPNTSPVTSDDIIKAYRKILTPGFIQNTEDVLTAAYTMFKPLVAHEYPTDPFSQLAEKFGFLGNPALTTGQTIHIQYYYDFFSDMAQAYDEFCKTGKELMSVCCPDETLFPRHLLLGEAIPLPDNGPSAVRHYFIYSPLFECRNLIFSLRTLFRRMHLMLTSFDTPASVVGGTASNDTNLRVTPSQLGSIPLSVKSIPYYYKLSKASPSSLHKFWSVEKKLRNKTDQTLSYNADIYASEQFVLKPLLFDLEPNNFLRVEGVVGKNITGVLSSIQKRINENRLPVQVVALKTGTPIVEGFDPKSAGCNTQDLELSFDIVRREWEAIIGKTIEYIDDNKAGAKFLIDDGHPDQLNNFMIDLHLSKTYIEDSREQLPAFALVYEDFIPVFERIENRAQKIRLQLMDMLKDPNKKNLDRLLAEDIIDHLDEVVMSCRKGAFRAIYQEYSRRLEDIYAKMFFSGYAKKNPGLQHKAGVPVGGTFILVYHAKPIKLGLKLTKKMKDSIKKGPFIIQGTVLDEHFSPVMGAAVKEEIGTKVMTSVNGKFTLSLSQLPTIISVKAPGFEVYEEIISSPTKKKEIQLKAEVVASTGVGSLANGTVIADFYLPYSCCSDCSPIQFVIQEPPPNQPPVARPGDSISIELPQDSVTLDGFASDDPDGTIQTYLWEVVSKPDEADDPVIHTADLFKTLVTGLVEGRYIFKLTVTDNDGATNTAPINIEVLPKPNVPPTAVIKADSTVVTLSDDGKAAVKLSGKDSTDIDGTVDSYDWTPASQNGATVESPGADETNVNFTKEGKYTFTLTVKDNKGAPGTANIEITVNKAPIVSVTANPANPILSPTAGKVASNLTGTVTDPDDSVFTLSWSIIDNPGSGCTILPPANTKNAVAEFTKTGNYKIRLSATDSKGAVGTGDVNITVTATNQLPVVNAGTDQTVTLPNIVTLAGTANDPDGSITGVKWTKKSGPAGETINGSTTLTAVISFLNAGPYVFTLTATDNNGDTSSDDVNVTVNRALTEKNCGNLNSVVALFAKLEETDPTNFQAFKGDLFASYADVETYFKQLSDIAVSSTDKQIDFFINFKLGSQTVNQLISKWLNELFTLITNPRRKNMQLLSLGMYRILNALSLYIACIQNEDIDKAKMPMIVVFDLMRQHFSAFTTAQIAAMSPQSQNMLRAIKKMIEAASVNLVDSGEIENKPIYGDELQQLTDILKNLGL
jgi:PKD domain